MAETIRADQIEGLTDLIRDQVRLAIQVESRPDLQNVDEVRRSPAGTLIRLEGKIDALKMEMDQRFEAVDQRFDALKAEMDQRFESLEDKMDQRFQIVDQRFKAVDQRFESLEDKMDHRFDALDRRFKLFQWVVILMFSLLIAMAGKLFSM